MLPPCLTGVDRRGSVSPLFIIAQAVRAILLASATAAVCAAYVAEALATSPSSACCPASWRALITAVAPETSNTRNRSLPARLIPPIRCLPPVERSFGVMCGRPVGARAEENADGLVGCDHVFGLLTRRHVRWPRWGPRPSPKQFCGFESRHANRVLWIIGSTDRHLIQLFHPGTNARFRRRPANAGPCHARHRDPCRVGHLVAQSRPNPRGGSIACSSERSRSTIARNASAVALSC